MKFQNQFLPLLGTQHTEINKYDHRNRVLFSVFSTNFQYSRDFLIEIFVRLSTCSFVSVILALVLYKELEENPVFIKNVKFFLRSGWEDPVHLLKARAWIFLTLLFRRMDFQ